MEYCIDMPCRLSGRDTFSGELGEKIFSSFSFSISSAEVGAAYPFKFKYCAVSFFYLKLSLGGTSRKGTVDQKWSVDIRCKMG